WIGVRPPVHARAVSPSIPPSLYFRPSSLTPSIFFCLPFSVIVASCSPKNFSKFSFASAKDNLLKFSGEQDATITENGKQKKIEGVKLDGRKYKLGGIEGETARAWTGGLTPIQVDAILELQLHRLTQLSVDEILKELKSIRERIAELEEILASEKKLKSV